MSLFNVGFSRMEYRGTDFWQQAAKNTAKGGDSDNSEVETAFPLSPQTEKNYEKVNQDFHDIIDRKLVRFLLLPLPRRRLYDQALLCPSVCVWAGLRRDVSSQPVVKTQYLQIGLWCGWLTVVLQCCDTVGWVMWPVKSSPKWPTMCRVGR